MVCLNYVFLLSSFVTPCCFSLVVSLTTLYITKTKDPEINNGYAFFKVEGSEDNPEPKKKSKPLHKSIQKFEEQFKPKETELDTHELSLRVEKLEKIVAALWKDKGDDDIPF